MKKVPIFVTDNQSKKDIKREQTLLEKLFIFFAWLALTKLSFLSRLIISCKNQIQLNIKQIKRILIIKTPCNFYGKQKKCCWVCSIIFLIILNEKVPIFVTDNKSKKYTKREQILLEKLFIFFAWLALTNLSLI